MKNIVIDAGVIVSNFRHTESINDDVLGDWEKIVCDFDPCVFINLK